MLSKLKLKNLLYIVFYLRFSTTESIKPNFFASSAVIKLSRSKATDISTLCIGQAASMGSFLLAAGTNGKRFSLPNSRIMVHQPSAGFQGQATDIEIHANEVLSLKKRLNEIYSKHTGKSVEEIK